jgi:hypothetical protein
MDKQEAVEWLSTLQQSLWPSDRKGREREWLALEAHRQLTQEEFSTLSSVIEEQDLITSMFCSNHFGGYGMAVYQDPIFPGDTPQRILTLVEGNLPDPTLWDHLEEEARTPRKTKCRDDAWVFFSKYTHSEKNVSWLAMFNLPKSESRDHYHY